MRSYSLSVTVSYSFHSSDFTDFLHLTEFCYKAFYNLYKISRDNCFAKWVAVGTLSNKFVLVVRLVLDNKGCEPCSRHKLVHSRTELRIVSRTRIFYDRGVRTICSLLLSSKNMVVWIDEKWYLRRTCIICNWLPIAKFMTILQLLVVFLWGLPVGVKIVPILKN